MMIGMVLHCFVRAVYNLDQANCFEHDFVVVVAWVVSEVLMVPFVFVVDKDMVVAAY